ncbi:LPS export ABC transporter periplasmic protein LptC [Parabacteroides sp.]
MTETRFLSKTDKYGITTTFGVVVMLLLFMASCGKDNKEVVEVTFDPENTYTMKATDVTSLISDSGITRYRLNAKEWLVFGKAEDPYWYFPEGIYVEKFDTLFQTEASIKADTAYHWDKKGLWKLIGNVEVESLQGENFQTSLLYWDQKEEKIYSDQYIRIEQEDKIITGIGFESNQDMTKYKIFNSQGTFPVNNTTPDSSRVNTAVADTTVVEVAKADSIKND